jgi:hypothetical protein
MNNGQARGFGGGLTSVFLSSWLGVSGLGVGGLYLIDHFGGTEPWLLVIVNGIGVGVAQGMVLRTRMLISLRGVALWALGCLVGEFALLGLTHYDGGFAELLQPGIVAGLAGLCAGVIQDAVLPRPSGLDGVWMLASAVSSGIGWPLGIALGTLLVNYKTTWEFGWFGAGALSGLCLVVLLNAADKARRDPG